MPWLCVFKLSDLFELNEDGNHRPVLLNAFCVECFISAKDGAQAMGENLQYVRLEMESELIRNPSGIV